MSELTPEKPSSQPRVPADYYCDPAPGGPRLVPRWVPIGCGTASLVILVILFAGGAAVNRGGGTRILDWGVGEMQREIVGMCDADVKPTQKTDFAAEMSALRERIKTQKVKADDLVGALQSMRDAISDQSVSSSELDQLTTKLHAINNGR